MSSCISGMCSVARGIPLDPLDAEPVDVPEESLGVPGRELGERELRLGGAGDRLVVDIGQIHDLRDPPALPLQVPPQDVFPEEGPEVSDVHDVVDGRSAGVHPDVPGLEGRDVGHPAAQRVEGLHQTPFSLRR